MNLEVEAYLEQKKRWPQEGRHILAQYDDEAVVVYQAYRPAIGLFAAEHQYFGAPFSYSRMSWIKPNFLWMMYRSGWGSKPGQEVILAISLKRDFFASLLSSAVPSSNDGSFQPDEWKQLMKNSNVRLQWDPDHDPYGGKCLRRALQLGLRNDSLEPFRGEGIIGISDISDFVAEQRAFVEAGKLDKLLTPREEVYPQ